jgi:hypothetical protein
MTQPKRRKPREWWFVQWHDCNPPISMFPDYEWESAREIRNHFHSAFPCKRIIKVREVPKPAARKGRKR